MLDKSYYHLRKYLAAKFQSDVDCPNIKTTLEALDACNFIAAYKEIGKMVSKKQKNAIIEGMTVSHDSVMDIKLRACKHMILLTGNDASVMEYAIRKNLDFACCSRSSYGDCLIALFANVVPQREGSEVLEKMIGLSQAMYRTDYDYSRIREYFPELFDFVEKYVDRSTLERIQEDAAILEHEWIS